MRSANVEAIAHLNKGLKALKSLPEAPERIQQELALQTALAPALVVSQGFNAPEVEYAYTRAYQLCQQVGETPHLFTVLSGLARFYFTRGELQTARELGEQLLTLAQRQHNPAFLLDAYLALGSTLCLLGEFVSAHAHLKQARILHDTQRSHFLAFRHGRVPGIHCLAWMSWTLWVLGYPDQALQRLQEALTLAQELSHPYTVGFVLNCVMQLSRQFNDVQVVQEKSEVMIALATEHSFPSWLAVGIIYRGWMLA